MTDSQFLIKMADSTKVTPFKIRLRKIARFIAEVEQFDVEDGVRKLRETLKKGKMLINTKLQEERIIDKVSTKAIERHVSLSDIDALVAIIERLDAVITDKDAMIKRLQQGHKVL